MGTFCQHQILFAWCCWCMLFHWKHSLFTFFMVFVPFCHKLNVADAVNKVFRHLWDIVCECVSHEQFGCTRVNRCLPLLQYGMCILWAKSINSVRKLISEETWAQAMYWQVLHGRRFLAYFSVSEYIFSLERQSSAYLVFHFSPTQENEFE